MKPLKCGLGGFLRNIDKEKKEGNTLAGREASVSLRQNFFGEGEEIDFVFVFLSFCRHFYCEDFSDIREPWSNQEL